MPVVQPVLETVTNTERERGGGGGGGGGRAETDRQRFGVRKKKNRQHLRQSAMSTFCTWKKKISNFASKFSSQG